MAELAHRDIWPSPGRDSWRIIEHPRRALCHVGHHQYSALHIHTHIHTHTHIYRYVYLPVQTLTTETHLPLHVPKKGLPKCIKTTLKSSLFKKVLLWLQCFTAWFFKSGLIQNKVTDRHVYLCGVRLPLAAGSALLAAYDKGQHLSGALGEHIWSSLLTAIFGQL